jgi:hypothetical protein
MKNIKNWKQFESSDWDDDDDSVNPIGVDNLSSQATHGMEFIFSPLESDMVEEWNSDPKIKKWVSEGKIVLNQLTSDSWEIYALSGLEEVKHYINKKFSW